MKKIWSLILAVALIMTTFVSVPVSAAGIAAEDIKVSTGVYDLKCTVEATSKSTMTVMITDSTSEELYGIQSSKSPQAVLNGAGEVVGYRYIFDFNMPKEADTDEYKVSIGFRGKNTYTTFPYAALDDKIGFYDILNEKQSTEIKSYLTAEEQKLLLPISLNDYLALEAKDSAVFAQVNEQIADIPLAINVADSDTTETKVEKLTPVANKFTTRYTELMEVAEMVTTPADEWSEFVALMQGTENFGSYYYKEQKDDKGNILLDKSAVVTANEVYAKFRNEIPSMTKYTADECKVMFDKATLSYIEESRSVGIFKDAFTRLVLSDETATIDISEAGKANIEKVLASADSADFWDSLRAANNTNCDAIISNAETIAQTMLNSDTSGGTTSGTTGGTEIDRPTGGGGGGSIGGGSSSKPVKPEDPKEPDTPEVPEGAFTDIADIDWAKESIEALAEMGVLAGKGNGKFAPNDNVTREEFIKIVVAAFDLTEEGAECDFADVSKDSWSYSFIASAAKLGIVSGDGASFNPASGISRQDMAVIIHRVFEHLGAEIKGDSVSFDDDAEISEYAKSAVEALTAAGIINGMGDGTFAPNGTVTRAQATKVVYGLLNLVGGGK